MEQNLTELEEKILDLRTKKGYTIENTLKELKIPRRVFKETVELLQEKGLYKEEDVKKAIKNKKNREYVEKNKTRKKLSPEEEDYRKKCIDFMCKKYFDYERTKKFNPVLVAKLQNLNKLCSYKVIFNTIKYQERSLDYANLKPMASEYQKISYMMAIIKNNLNVVYKKIQKQEKIQEGKDKQIDDKKLVNQLNKNIISKPSEKIDMSNFLDD